MGVTFAIVFGLVAFAAVYVAILLVGFTRAKAGMERAD